MNIKWAKFEDIEVGDRIYIVDVWRTVEQVGTHEDQGNPEIGWIAGSYEPQEEEGTTWQIRGLYI